MFVSSALLSGVHTIPVVRAGIPITVADWLADAVSYAGFLTVELPILLATFAMTGNSGMAVKLTLLLATLTALTCNIYSVVNAYAAASLSGDVWTLIVAIIVGIVAPGIAFLSGKMFVQMHRADRSIRQRAQDRFDQESQAWDERVDQAWTAYNARVQMDAQMDGDGQSSKRVSNPASIVREHYVQHPEDLDRSVRKLAEQLGVSHGTVSNVRQSMMSEDRSSNGTH